MISPNSFRDYLVLGGFHPAETVVAYCSPDMLGLRRIRRALVLGAIAWGSQCWDCENGCSEDGQCRSREHDHRRHRKASERETAKGTAEGEPCNT